MNGGNACRNKILGSIDKAYKYTNGKYQTPFGVKNLKLRLYNISHNVCDNIWEPFAYAVLR